MATVVLNPPEAPASTKQTVSTDQLLELTGLLTLADRLNEQLEQIWAAALSITGEADETGLTCAAIYDHDHAPPSQRAGRLLKELGVRVAANPDDGGMPR
jgi:hypothetical protein